MVKISNQPRYTQSLMLEIGKNPHCLSSVLFRFYQISGFVRFGFGKNESSVRVRFFVQSSVLFGSMQVLK